MQLNFYSVDNTRKGLFMINKTLIDFWVKSTENVCENAGVKGSSFIPYKI